jgi:hypothetical protein
MWMLLSSITINNYKSYLEPQTVEISRGFNVFLGANNSGKTTMLEPLDLQFGVQSLHRSIWNLPTYDDQPSGESIFTISIETTLDELLAGASQCIAIPLAKDFKDELSKMDAPLNEAAILNAFQKHPRMMIELAYSQGKESISVETILGKSPLFQFNGNEMATVFRIYNYGSKTKQIAGGIAQQLPPEEMRFGNGFKKLFYRFSAQRNPAIQSGFGAPILSRDASNLASCLSQLQLNDAYGHQILCGWIHRVFPSVKWVQAPALGNNQWHIQCLPHTPEERRNDLAVTLDQMGTGIGNVIAILYVVLVSRRPQVIAIDEPNSFLHPRALRELLGILAMEGGQHQYILTAHSPDVLTAVNPSTVTMFSTEGGRTRTRQVKGTQIKDLRSDLSDLGIRMTDLHGRDRVLWVEGQTEELVIPDLLQKFCPTVSAGTAVLRVEHTGTFEKKGIDVSEVVKVYTRLSEGSALVPPMVAILLDREGRSQEESERLINKCNGTLFLLDRPMLEDYILNADAIAAQLNALGENVDSAQVEERIASATSSDSAAKILSGIFSDFTEARNEFHKTRDVPSIISWLLENNPDFLAPLGICLKKLFSNR